MAIPTRPAQDGIIDPVWGQWVHDELVNRGIKAITVLTAPQTFNDLNPHDVVGFSVTFTTLANRRYRLAAQMQGAPNNPAHSVLYLYEGTTQLNSASAASTVGGGGASLKPEVFLTPTPGPHTYKGTIHFLAGTGGVAFSSAATPSWLMLEDVGPVNP